jgi:sulfatase maturation enzyme AslB (radical SAM superfamily)
MNLEPYKNCFAHKKAIYISNEEPNSRPCCFYGHNVDADTWEEYQTKIAVTDIETGCRHCINAEQSGGWSHRQQYEESFYTDNNMFVLGLCVDNICNIKCTTCGPRHSSKWIEDYTKLGFWKNPDEKKSYIRMMNQGPDKLKLAKNIIENANFDIIKIDVFGGEPTINPVVMDFVEWLADSDMSDRVILALTTNGTTYLENMDKYIDRFKNVAIQVSIDGINEHYNHLRYGAEWTETEANVIKYYKTMLSNSKVTLSIHYTLSWMNALHFKDFMSWLINNFNLHKIGLYLTKVMGPAEYSVDILKPEHKQEIYDINEAHIMKAIHPIKVLNITARTKIFNKTNFEMETQVNHLLKLYKDAMLTYSEPFYTKDNWTFKALFKLGSLDKVRNTDYTKTFADMLTYLPKLKEQPII